MFIISELNEIYIYIYIYLLFCLLNDIYIDSDDGMEDPERSLVPENLGTGSLECPSWVQQDSHQSSPPQTSGNSYSASA